MIQVRKYKNCNILLQFSKWRNFYIQKVYQQETNDIVMKQFVEEELRKWLKELLIEK